MFDGRGDTETQGEIETGRRRSFVARRRKRRIKRALIALCAVICLSVISYTMIYAFSSGAETGSSSSGATSPAQSDGEGTRENTQQETSGEESVEAPPPQASCDGMLVQVGKDSVLPPTYAPQDLGSMLSAGIPTNGGEMYLRARAIAPLARMTADATAAGEELVVVSAYRSYADQEATFAHYSTIYGPGEVEMVSAPPGQSQHQLGTTVDFSNAEVGYQLIPTFSQTSASAWLEENAWKYGYVNTYPEGDEAGTGRQYEAWEYRFVGKATAKEIQDQDTSLSAYLKDRGYPPKC